MTNPTDAVVRPKTARSWQNGWYHGAARLDSPNFGARPPLAQIDLIVLHSISLPPGRYGGDEDVYKRQAPIVAAAHQSVSCHIW